jgi:CO dehydrogenase nickel-insertion accessory protein CooC1
MSQVNYGFVINKYQENKYTHELIKAADDKIIGHIPYDDGIFQYEYDQVSDTTKISIQKIYDYCTQHK